MIAPLWSALSEVDNRALGESRDLPLLSVSQTHGVVRFADLFPDRSVRASDHEHYKVAEEGDIVLNKMSAASGAVAACGERGMVSPDYAVYRTTDTHCPKYLEYVLSSGWFCEGFVRPALRGIGAGGATNVRTPRISTGNYLVFKVPLPPLSTQRAIADYLDRETAQIDAMAAELDGLVARLEERRTSSIGQDESWDSGMVALGMLCNFNSGGTPPTSDTAMWAEGDSGTPWVAISDMSAVDLVKETKKSVTQLGIDTARLSVGESGTVLFAMYASVGAVSILDIKATWNQAILGLSPNDPETLDPEWLFYSLHRLKPELPLYYRSNTQNNLNAEQVKALRIPIPSLLTQRETVKRIQDRHSEIDSMIADAKELKALLTERRSALITEVVTGRKEVPVP